MSKRESDGECDGPPSKMRRDDLDDGGGAGRSGRVRKKSAKVLEMEEFEQVEKTQHVTKKGKTPKTPGRLPSLQEEDMVPSEKAPVKKVKTPKAAAVSGFPTALEVTPVSTKVSKVGSGQSELSAQLAKPVQQFVPVQTSGILTTGLTGSLTLNPTELLAATIKQEYENELPMVSELGLQQHLLQTSSPVRTEEQKSVIKYLLSSPTSSAKPAVNTNALTKIGSPSSSHDTIGEAAVSKKSAKKSKAQEKSTKSKAKEKKQKEMSPTSAMDVLAGLDPSGASLKMKIFSSSDPMSAQVSLNPQSDTELQASTKPKKPKKAKPKKTDSDVPLTSTDLLTLSGLDTEDLANIHDKKSAKKVSKKKEKLIQDAISAAQQMPNLAALVASQTQIQGQGQGQMVTQVTLATPGQKAPKSEKKKLKSTAKASASDDPSESELKSELRLGLGDDGEEEEANLVIAETERKRKKTTSKKKVISKDKTASGSPKGEKAEKKLSKRAPTAYMLFCNTHRPTIVSENPGIEFAGISRKLGEMWQTLSNKQKLQWRRKAQRRRKKGSNLISTGKTGKETSLATGTHASSAPSNLTPALKLSTLMQKAQRSSPDDTPQSPTKNFSIEPIDVAAHLKLLGESLSIIGMRLQEHKGMIAVQGSLSVLLDSLLCACGPLLCLTQQVPGMDGCSPLVHGQTLDSVAYVMPGL